VSAEAVKALQRHRRVRVTALVGDKSNRTRAVDHRLVLVG
jgi:hypothetical protein